MFNFSPRYDTLDIWNNKKQLIFNILFNYTPKCYPNPPHSSSSIEVFFYFSWYVPMSLYIFQYYKMLKLTYYQIKSTEYFIAIKWKKMSIYCVCVYIEILCECDIIHFAVWLKYCKKIKINVIHLIFPHFFW